MSQSIGGTNRYAHSLHKEAAECPNCKNRTVLDLADRRRLWPVLTTNLAPPSGEYVMELAWRCTYCSMSTLTLMRFEAGESQDREPVETTQVWPPQEARSLADVVPEPIRSLFVEASRAESANALRGAAGLYRAAVERLCDDRRTSGRNLAERIDALEHAGLSPDVVAALHEARLLGNWSLHDGLEFSAEEVADVAELIVEACHLIYVQPDQRRALLEQRQARRAAFRARDTSS